jgi:hypothetical protein
MQNPRSRYVGAVFLAIALAGIGAGCASGASQASSTTVTTSSRIGLPSFTPRSFAVPDGFALAGGLVNCATGASNSLPGDQVHGDCSYYHISHQGFIALYLVKDSQSTQATPLTPSMRSLSSALTSRGWKTTKLTTSTIGFTQHGWSVTAIFAHSPYLGSSPTGSLTHESSVQVTVVLAAT